MNIIEQYESKVRYYSRIFPNTFVTAKGALLYAQNKKKYIDFFSGAGALNYGHNNEVIKQAAIDYLSKDGVIHSLDMATEAKEKFLQSLQENILLPRGYNYKVMFTGPTGTDAVEAALKLARTFTGRRDIAAFTNAYHGLSLGSLATTSNISKRQAAYVDLPNVIRLPYDNYFGDGIATLDMIEKIFSGSSYGYSFPAAVILETIQGEGGVNPASKKWIQGLSSLAKQWGSLLIVDDIQVGNGRTGDFFSFESLGIEPDIICLSKSLSGLGLPMAVVLVKSEFDVLESGGHAGTFRGNNLSFVCSTAAIEQYWKNNEFSQSIYSKSKIVLRELNAIKNEYNLEFRGRGLIYGIELPNMETATKARENCFKKGLLIETAGPKRNVLKLLPPLIIEEALLHDGLDIIKDSLTSSLSENLN